MKQILTAMALMLCLGSKAQTIPARIDTSSQTWICNIEPIPITATNDSLNLTQVRVSSYGGCWMWYANLRFGLYYAEPGTGRMKEFQGWTVTVNYTNAIPNPVQAAFGYFRDSFTVNGVQLYQVVYIP